MLWNEVLSRHRDGKGVRVTEGRVLSVLCSSGPHGDDVGDEKIEYRVPTRRSYASANRALERAQKEQYAFTLFRKIGKNNWIDAGLYKVAAIQILEPVVTYSLTRSP